VATFDRRGTVAVGRPLPIRAGQTTSTIALSASRTVSGATVYGRTGSTTSALAPSGSATLTPLGTTRDRGGIVAVGRVPIDRTGATDLGHTLSASRIVGSPGAMMDRSGLVAIGRIARLRSGAIGLGHVLSGNAEVLEAGTHERSGGGGGGQGVPGGLLLALQAHPGATLTASVTLGSNIPARSGAIIGKTRLSADRDRDLSRSGAIVTAIVIVGHRVFTGNRNRNGQITAKHALSGAVVRVRLSQVTGAIVAGQTIIGSSEVGVTPIYSRSSTIVTRTRLSGRRVTHAGVFDRGAMIEMHTVLAGRVRYRPVGSRTYVFGRQVTTGRMGNVEREGVMVP